MDFFKKSLEFPRHILWVFLAYAFGLWWYSVPFTGDEKLYISTAIEMWQKGDWIYPWLAGQHSYYKPPFEYWTMLAGWKVFGFNNFGTFVGSAFATSATAFFLDEIVISFGVPTQLALAGIWFSGCIGTLTYGSSAQMEIWTVFFYSGAWWAALKFLNTRETAWIYIAYLMTGFAALVKSPVYSVFWVLGFIFYLILSGNRTFFRSVHFYSSLLFGMAVGLSWYLVIYFTDYSHFWEQYVMYETLSKRWFNNAPVWWIWANLILFCVPFFLLVFPFIEFRKKWVFLLSWALFPSLFFCIFPYRTETYLYILVPLIALFVNPVRSFCRLNSLLFFVLISVISLIFFAAGILPWWISALLLISGLLQLFFGWQISLKPLSFSFLFIVLIFRVGAIFLGESDISFLRKVAQQNPARLISFYDEGTNVWHELGLLSTALGKPAKRVSNISEAISVLKNGDLLVLNDGQWESALPQLKTNLGEKLEVARWLRWKRGFKFPTLKNMLSLADTHSEQWENLNKREYRIVWLKH